MTKPLSTYERKMKDVDFKESFDEGYHELLLSELMISIMENDDKSIRKLAKEAKLSPSVIQDLRTGKQQDIKVSNFVHIANALGYEVILKKDKESLTIQEKIKDSKKYLSFVSIAC
jgi:DNA-binding Xre family transcriptional regulator